MHRLFALLITLLPVTAASQSVIPITTPHMPSLQLQTLDAHPWRLHDQLGKWVVVNFWATWCSPCLKEMPELSQLHTNNETIEVIGLAYEEIEHAQMVEFLTHHLVSYPIAIIDPFAPLAEIAPPRGLPMTLLIAPNGVLMQQFLGPVTAQILQQAIAESERKTL